MTGDPLDVLYERHDTRAGFYAHRRGANRRGAFGRGARLGEGRRPISCVSSCFCKESTSRRARVGSNSRCRLSRVSKRIAQRRAICSIIAIIGTHRFNCV